MIIQKDSKILQLSDKGQEHSKSPYHWLAQYDEEDDFLRDVALNLLPNITEEK
ncbi:MAG: hypothetical protein HQL12_09730 [Candidatus Omnitrophica bacterium]|nr:hypothetical protein [Candidatus Omnitrophota bacterium]